MGGREERFLAPAWGKGAPPWCARRLQSHSPLGKTVGLATRSIHQVFSIHILSVTSNGVCNRHTGTGPAWPGNRTFVNSSPSTSTRPVPRHHRSGDGRTTRHTVTGVPSGRFPVPALRCVGV